MTRPLQHRARSRRSGRCHRDQDQKTLSCVAGRSPTTRRSAPAAARLRKATPLTSAPTHKRSTIWMAAKLPGPAFGDWKKCNPSRSAQLSRALAGSVESCGKGVAPAALRVAASATIPTWASRFIGVVGSGSTAAFNWKNAKPAGDLHIFRKNDSVGGADLWPANPPAACPSHLGIHGSEADTSENWC